MSEVVILDVPFELHRVPAMPGCYVLEMVVTARLELEVGRLGSVVLGPGTLRYVGSARGPGGLRARVRRHLEPHGRRERWHIDALTRVLRPHRVELWRGRDECSLVAGLLALAWAAPAPRFGSSDCRRCPAHLLALATGRAET